MGRGNILTPKDNVARLFSQFNDSPFTEYWKKKELVEKRLQYAAELQSQIREKEEIRLREQSIINLVPPPTGFSIPHPLPSQPDPLLDMSLQSTSASLAPILTHAQSFSEKDNNNNLPPSPPQPSSAPPFLLEKDKLIASMELGQSHALTKVRRNTTAPLPLGTMPAATPMQLGRTKSIEEEALEAELRKEHFKAELERQVQEKKRLKALEAERERQWEAEQETRLEKEREQLRREFEAEHAARRAKVAVEQAEAASAGAISADSAEPGVRIFAPKRKSAVPRKQTPFPSSSSGGEEGEASFRMERRVSSSSASLVSKRQEKEAAARPFTAAATVNSASKEEEEESFTLSKQPINEHKANQVQQTATTTTTSATTLAEQVEELKQLHAALQRDLLIQKSVLELLKDTRFTANGALPPPPPPRAIYLTANPLTLPPAAAAPPAFALPMQPTQCTNNNNTLSKQPAVNSIPILYTSSELRYEEDSRPATGTIQQQQPAAAVERRRPTTAARLMKASSKLETIKEGKETKLEKEQKPKKAVPLGRKTEKPRGGPLGTSTVSPSNAAEKLTIWKRASTKFKKLSVGKAVGAEEESWVIRNEESAL